MYRPKTVKTSTTHSLNPIYRIVYLCGEEPKRSSSTECLHCKKALSGTFLGTMKVSWISSIPQRAWDQSENSV